MTKSLAFFSVMLIGLALLATVIYQSGVIQSLEKNKKQFNSNVAIQETVKETTQKAPQEINKVRPEPLLSNPNGTIAIAIIRPKPTLENIILDALESDSFDVKF